jgi:hypothetical protein
VIDDQREVIGFDPASSTKKLPSMQVQSEAEDGAGKA